MKLNKCVLTIGLLIAASIASAETKIETGAYQIDPMHSKVGFEIPHLVISTVEGKFKTFQGKLDLNENFTKSKLEASADIDSIDTGVSKRDDHLKGPDFFDAKKYPKMTLVSKSISGTPESFKLEGDLTIHGKTKRVTFDGKYLGAVTDGFGNRKAAFQASTKINRKDFGLTWNNMVEAGPVVGDQVTIDLKIQAAKAAEKAPQAVSKK